MDYSIVIPCFNEEATIKLILDKTNKAFQEHNIELILVNNGSTDNTKNILKDLIINIITNVRQNFSIITCFNNSSSI